MASLRDIAREYKDEIMDGIAWVAIWKTGRSWNARAFRLNLDTEKIEDEEMEEVRAIVAADENAIFINEYYTAHMGEGKLDEIVDGIRYMYEESYNLLKDSTAYDEPEDQEETNTEDNSMKILSCGAGMQSTALALMSCENARNPGKFPCVPVYDLVCFCDLGKEPPWVLRQVEFIRNACQQVGIRFEILKSPLYEDYLKDFGNKRVVSVPFWSIGEDGKKGKMLRNCTLEYKIGLIQKYVRWQLLGYRKGQRTKPEDIKRHEMHIGFSFEEKHRCRENPNKMFVNKFPLVDMGLERKDNYAYIRDCWGLETKASACSFCPYHRNFFFKYLKENEIQEYKDLVAFDEMLEREQPKTKITSKLYISRSRKRISDLLPDECNDAEYFPYKEKQVWNGF